MGLCRFVTERNITRIGRLKIYAKGSDFAIFKGTVENTAPDVSIDSITVECQWFNNAIPLYFISNDCGDIQH